MRQGCLQQVQNFVMKERITHFGEPKANTTFAQTMLMHANLWNLQKCDLYGSFCLNKAVGTLPTALKSLSLHALAGPLEFELSAFQRFKSLESLSLAYHWEDGSRQYRCDFILDCVLDNISTLDLSESDYLHCSFAPRCTLVTCLPNLTSFKANTRKVSELLVMRQLCRLCKNFFSCWLHQSCSYKKA